MLLLLLLLLMLLLVLIFFFFGGQGKVSDTSCGGVKLVTGDEYHEIEELTSWPLKQGCHIRFIVFQLFKEGFDEFILQS